jgi:5-methylcytosine-specific restriction endonuclease McrA
MIRLKADPHQLDHLSYESLRQQILRRDDWSRQSCGPMSNLEVRHRKFRSHSGADSEEKLDHAGHAAPCPHPSLKNWA